MKLAPKFWMAVLGQLSASIFLTGCGVTAHFATYAPQFAPNEASRFSIGTVSNTSDPLKGNGTPEGFNPSVELKTQLEKKLADSGLILDPNAPNVILLNPTITDYEPGNAARRWLFPGAGATVLTVKCNVQQGGIDMGKINVRRTIEAGGVYTIGDWRAVFKHVAKDIVDALKEKMGERK